MSKQAIATDGGVPMPMVSGQNPGRSQGNRAAKTTAAELVLSKAAGSTHLPDGCQIGEHGGGQHFLPLNGRQESASENAAAATVPAAAAAALLGAAVALPERADVLVTDMLDHR